MANSRRRSKQEVDGFYTLPTPPCVSLLSVARSLPSPARRASLQTCLCWRCSLCAVVGGVRGGGGGRGQTAKRKFKMKKTCILHRQNKDMDEGKTSATKIFSASHVNAGSPAGAEPRRRPCSVSGSAPLKVHILNAVNFIVLPKVLSHSKGSGRTHYKMCKTFGRFEMCIASLSLSQNDWFFSATAFC